MFVLAATSDNYAASLLENPIVKKNNYTTLVVDIADFNTKVLIEAKGVRCEQNTFPVFYDDGLSSGMFHMTVDCNTTIDDVIQLINTLFFS